jgi:hypothetical protein
MDRLKQCRQEDVKRDLCPIQPWKGKFRALDKYFNYEDIEEDKKVKHNTRLKGHATLWWDELQADRRCKGKQRIKSWDRMVPK